MGEAIWNFISSVYQLKWNSLYANKNNKSLREKITTKFSLIIIPMPNCNKSTKKPVPANIKKMLPPLPAKSKKEVNQILKYFKNTNPINGPKLGIKSYIQASK